MRRLLPRSLTTAAALLAAVALTACSDGPAAAGAGTARLAFAPAFSPRALAAVADLETLGISITSVKVVILRKATGEVLGEHLVAVEPGAASVTLEAEVNLLRDEEEVKVRLQFKEAGGVVLYAGEQVLVARVGTNSAAQIATTVIEYVGPGANAATLTIAPADTSISTVAPFALRAVAKDAAGAVIAEPLLVWSSSDPTLATVASTGLVTPLGLRGVVGITARIPSGVSGKASLRLVPPAAALSRISAAEPVGIVASPLAEPFRVRVLAADELPAAGEPVAFTAVTPGGIVRDATVHTDAEGYAATIVTLGQVTGAYTFRAIVGTLPPVEMTATATAAAASRIAVAAGDGQSALVGSVLEPLAVQVADPYGNPVSGATVAWRRASGTGVLASPTSVTDTAGIARVTYTLGTIAGTEVVVASLQDATAEAQFTLTALPLPLVAPR